MLQHFSMELSETLTLNGLTLLRLLPIDCEEGGGCVEEFDEVEFSEMGGIVSRSSELLAEEYSVAPTTILGSRNKKKNIMRNGMQIIWDGLYKVQNEV